MTARSAWPHKVSPRDKQVSERAQHFLKALIERYIREGQPIGSRTLAKDTGLDLSPATVRNVLSDLEEMGLVVSPHTSAGRIPTAAGYRLFIDSLLTVKPLSEQDMESMRQGLGPQRDATALIESASQLLSGITHMAGVVMIPRHERNVFRQIELLPLSCNRILAILVTSDGEVHNRILQHRALLHPGGVGAGGRLPEWSVHRPGHARRAQASARRSAAGTCPHGRGHGAGGGDGPAGGGGRRRRCAFEVTTGLPLRMASFATPADFGEDDVLSGDPVDRVGADGAVGSWMSQMTAFQVPFIWAVWQMAPVIMRPAPTQPTLIGRPSAWRFSSFRLIIVHSPSRPFASRG